MTKLLFVPGSLREASSSRAVMRALIERLAARADCAVADVGALPLYNADIAGNPEAKAFEAAVAEADGVVFVTPEYNYSVPGLLKNAIDWASRPAYGSVFKGKPCFVVTTSGGALGGVRAQAHLKYILNGMLARLHPSVEVIVPKANEKTRDGRFADADILDFAERHLTDFIAALD